ncbi:MAG TPA: R3H domain-containing nucleic acid-binding protein [Thermoanaerobaculia bacterium]|nr:R3H domain-containing nucleic acid-binding protein [Thermoanaerobaculia bacterium]
MTRRFFSGDSEAQAVIEAAGFFGLEPAQLAYQKVEKRHGFLKRRRRVVIEVDPAAPRRSVPATEVLPPLPEARRRESAAAWSPGRDEPAAEPGAPRRVRDAVGSLLAVAELDGEVTVTVQRGPEGWEVDLAGAGAGALLAAQGELLYALEHLALRMVRDALAEGEQVRVDSGGFRAQRVAALQRRAREAAATVRESGEAVAFEALHAAERRVVHLAIRDEPGVTTQSEGDGERRLLRVLPAARTREPAVEI